MQLNLLIISVKFLIKSRLIAYFLPLARSFIMFISKSFLVLLLICLAGLIYLLYDLFVSEIKLRVEDQINKSKLNDLMAAHYKHQLNLTEQQYNLSQQLICELEFQVKAFNAQINNYKQQLDLTKQQFNISQELVRRLESQVKEFNSRPSNTYISATAKETIFIEMQKAGIIIEFTDSISTMYNRSRIAINDVNKSPTEQEYARTAWNMCWILLNCFSELADKSGPYSRSFFEDGAISD